MKITTITAAVVVTLALLLGAGWLVSDLENSRNQVTRLNLTRCSSEDLVRNWGLLKDSLGRAATDYDAGRERAAYRAFVQSCDFTPHAVLDLGVTRRNAQGESLGTLSEQVLGIGAEMARRAENLFGLVAIRRNLSEESRSLINIRSRKAQVAAEVEATAEVTRRAMSRLDAMNALLAEEVAALVDRERVQSRRLYGLIGAGILGLGLCLAGFLRSRHLSDAQPSPIAASEAVEDVDPEMVPVDLSDLVPCGAVFAKVNQLPSREFRQEDPWLLPNDRRSSWSVQMSPTEKSPAGQARTVLVVEDDVQVRTLTGEVLRGQGYDVIEARNGFEALRMAERDSVSLDLVLSDIVMPRMSGHDLAERLAVRRPELPVLFMSGYLDDAIAPRDGAASHRPLLHKPFSPDDLARSVREILAGSVSGN